LLVSPAPSCLATDHLPLLKSALISRESQHRISAEKGGF
jgi:hypothetical protein